MCRLASVNLHAIQYEELDAGIAQESSRLNLGQPLARYTVQTSNDPSCRGDPRVQDALPKPLRNRSRSPWVNDCRTYAGWKDIRYQVDTFAYNSKLSLTRLVFRVLAGAMKNVNVYTINPKSLSMGKLYGEFDPSTREWKNGIITGSMSDFSKGDALTVTVIQSLFASAHRQHRRIGNGLFSMGLWTLYGLRT